MKAQRAVWLIAAAFVAQAAAADILYDAETNRITVSGYLEERPATLDDVLAAECHLGPKPALSSQGRVHLPAAAPWVRARVSARMWRMISRRTESKSPVSMV